MPPRTFALAALLAVVAGQVASAQVTPPPAAAATAADTARRAVGATPRVFVDCQQLYCDLDFIRTEITWVDHVRDRTVADVHALVTRQTTGAGGGEYTIAFIGLRDFAGVSDTLRWIAAPAVAEDAIRRGLVQTLQAGLVRYVARAGQTDRVQIASRTAAAGTTPTQPTQPADDPWNFWVFRVRANGFTDGESQSRAFSGSSSASANRITADWKTTFAVNGSYSENEFTFGDGRSVKNYRNSYGANALAVKSLGEHWSAGATAAASSSSFLNQRLVLSAAPAIEYNVFPYSQVTRRQLTARYGVGVRSFAYDEETIFGRTRETRPFHELIVALDARQPWGSISTGLNASQYFHDVNKLSLGLFNSADLRLVRGLSLNMSGSVSLVRDQLYLPKRGATDEEVLLRRRQLETSYRYFVSAGLSYTFGSIFNNVVNPRFGGAGGGGQVFFF